MGVFQTPGLHTDLQDSKNLGEMAALGYRWITYQTQNDTQTKFRDLEPARRAGLSPGVWGVSYSQANLQRDAMVLRSQAEDFGADHLIFNVEGAHDPTPYLVELAGFEGSKALITLIGVLPDINAAKIAAAGWTIMPEAYYNDSTTLTPANAMFYMSRERVPRDQMAVAVGMYEGKLGVVSGRVYATLLAEAGVKHEFSAWMLEQATDLNIRDLITYMDLRETLEKLNLSNTGINAVLDRLEVVFDANGIGEPDGIDALRKHLLASGNKINEIVEQLNAQ